MRRITKKSETKVAMLSEEIEDSNLFFFFHLLCYTKG